MSNRGQLEILVKKYGDVMFRCAYSYCKNRQDSEDIVQEVFMKYLVKKPIFVDDAHERAWFLRVTINVSKNFVHSFWYKNVDGIKEDIRFISDEQKEIWECINELPEKYRIVLVLYYWEGYSLKEISKILQKNESTIGTRFDRGKRKLKDMLKEGR